MLYQIELCSALIQRHGNLLRDREKKADLQFVSPSLWHTDTELSAHPVSDFGPLPIDEPPLEKLVLEGPD